MKDDQNLYTVKVLLGPLLEMREEVLFRMSPSALFFRGKCSAGGLGSKLKYHVQKVKETREYKTWSFC